MPTVYLDNVELSDSGRPCFAPGEVQQATVNQAELQIDGHIGTLGRNAANCKDGYCILTNHRILWIERDARGSETKRSCSIPLPAIRGVATSSGMLSKMGFSPTAKLQLTVGVNSQRDVAALAADLATFNIKSTDSNGLTVFKGKLQPLIGSHSHRGPASRSIPPTPPMQPAVYVPAQPLVYQPKTKPEANQQHLESLTVMGFPHVRARIALLQTDNNLDAAIQWLFDNASRSTDELEQEYNPTPPEPQPSQDLTTNPLARGLAHNASLHSHPVPAGQTTSPPGSPERAFLDEAAPSNYYGAVPPRAQPRGAGAPSSSSSFEAPVLDADGNVGPLYASSVMNPLLGSSHAAPLPMAGPSRAVERSAAAGPRVIGVGGILRHEQALAEAQSSSVKQAFQDLQALMSKGESMVRLAKELRSKLASQPKAGGGTTAVVDNEVVMDSAMEQELIDLGIYSPVTRQSSGKRYEEDLARQLSDFLRAPLQRAGGMMTLQDVFCLFNRARGTELVSPDDLRAAADLCEKLNLSIQLRTFPSGVAVVQDAKFSDDNICRRLVELLSKSTQNSSPCEGSELGRGITATQTATELLQPIAVAKEQLLLAERRGFLCRDDGPEGLIFYRNVFKDIAMPSTSAC